MRKKIFMAAILAVTNVMTDALAQTVEEEVASDTNTGDDGYHKPHKSPKMNWMPKVSYNSASTALSVTFPANGQGGKVEIYRNGTKVVDATVAAGANLSYVLRDYGNGDYAVVVSFGNSVVYSGNMVVE
jgi:hypothetical protein